MTFNVEGFGFLLLPPALVISTFYFLNTNSLHHSYKYRPFKEATLIQVYLNRDDSYQTTKPSGTKRKNL